MIVAEISKVWQRNAREIAGPEWRWKQSEVSFVLLVIKKGSSRLDYSYNYTSVMVGLLDLHAYLSLHFLSLRLLFVTEDDIKGLPCFQVILLFLLWYILFIVHPFSLHAIVLYTLWFMLCDSTLSIENLHAFIGV